MSILVTGGAGFIGSHICDALLSKGESVVALDSFDDFYPVQRKERNLAGAQAHENFQLLRGDIRDEKVLDAIPGGVEAIIHLAARAGVRPSIENRYLYSDVNVMGTTGLLDWAGRRRVKTFVFASSSSVYGNSQTVPLSETLTVDNPISPYAATKKAGELLCYTASHLDGLTVACLRFFTVYGPRQRPDLAIHKFARLLSQDTPVPMYGDGESSRDYTYVSDTVSGVLAALAWAKRNRGAYQVFNLGNQRTVTLKDMIEVVADEMGVVPTIERHPTQPGDVKQTWADITQAREVLGYDPIVDFRSGVREFLRWFASEPRF